ncbi:MAG: hypothetical protein AB7U75_03530 [Hyphomicrobiaceae bacterium]
MSRHIVYSLSAMLVLWAGIIVSGEVKAAQEQKSSVPGETTIAGWAVSCKDIRGVAVTTMQVANLGDVGRAGVINRVPIIAIDPEIIGRLPNKLQLFFYQHECAHHVLGHWFQMSLTMETDADCWAIRHGRDNGIFSRDDVMSFAPFLAKSGGSPFGHLPGPQRAKQLLSCFDKP